MSLFRFPLSRAQRHLAIAGSSQRAVAFSRPMTTSPSWASPAAPRPSSSLIIVNPQNEILLVQRNPKAGSFAGAHVFPGGNFDSKQDDSLEITAIRETFEESGLLLASPHHGSSSRPSLSDAELDTAREAIHSQQDSFREFLARYHLTADTSSLLPFTQWVTPPIQPKRFRTQFFVVFLDASPSTGFSSGVKQERLPTPDGGQEVIKAQFVHPTTALQSVKSRHISLYPPQYYLLTTLSDILTGNTNTPEQRKKVGQLSSGLFGRMVINPRPLPQKDSESRTILTYEGDETRGGAPGRFHRVTVTFGKGGAINVEELLRNFDIYTEIEAHLLSDKARL